MSVNPSTVTSGTRERVVTPELRAAVDFGRTSEDYARFRPGPPPSFYDRLDAIVRLRGARVADVGAGTGLAAIEMARRGVDVIAIDPAANQLEQAARLAREAGVSIRTIVGKAEETGIESDSLDLFLASQAWHWFDPVRAGAEAMRTLRAGGVILAVAFDYLPLRSDLAKKTEELILKYNPTWPLAWGNGVHVKPLTDFPAAGFVGLEQFSYEHAQVFTHEGWRGRMRTCNGVGASLATDKVKAFDDDLAALLTREFPDPVEVMHRVWVVWGKKC